MLHYLVSSCVRLPFSAEQVVNRGFSGLFQSRLLLLEIKLMSADFAPKQWAQNAPLSWSATDDESTL